MSDERKPFAEGDVVTCVGRSVSEGFDVGGHYAVVGVDDDGDPVVWNPSMELARAEYARNFRLYYRHLHTETAAAAVEQREARLRGALTAVLEIAHCDDADLPPGWPQTLADARATLAGDGPDYVAGDVACGLAFDLGAAWSAIADLQQTTEALAEARGVDVLPFLRAKGLAEKTPAEELSTDEMIAELRKRNLHVYERKPLRTYTTGAQSETALHQTGGNFPVGVATEDLAEGQPVVIDFSTGTVSPICPSCGGAGAECACAP